MVTDKSEKQFDCVKWTREVRDRHYEETKQMSFEEWRSWLDEKLSNNSLLANAKAVAPESSRWHDHGFHRTGDGADTQVVVEITRDEISGTYSACALEGAISAKGASAEEIRVNAKASVLRYLEATDPLPRPKFICLRFLHEKAIAI